MGNQLDRITHLNYSELPTGDPSGIEKDELRVGVAYFFSDEEEDLDERGGGGGGGGVQQQEQPPKYSGVRGSSSPSEESPTHRHLRPPGPPLQLVLSEPLFSAFRGQECIFSKAGEGPPGGVVGGPLSLYPASALPSLCQPGDLVELLCLGGGPPDSPLSLHPPPPHWAVYVGAGQIVHLHQGQVRQDSLHEAGGAHVGRVVSDWYRYRPLGAELVVQNACGHLGLKSPEVCWTNSESFAAWCRFGKREFKAGAELLRRRRPPVTTTPDPPGASPDSHQQQQYYLQVWLADGQGGRTVRFQSLEDLIREKRRIDAGGRRRRGLQQLALVGGKE